MGGACWRPRGVPLPLGFSFCFSARVTRQVQHLGTRGEHSGFEAHRSLRAEVSWGSCPARWGAVQGSGKSGLGRGVGPGKGLIFFLAFLDCRERERELYGPKKRGPKPKTFLLKVTWPSPSSPLLGPQLGRSTGPAREGQLCRCLGGRLFQRGPSWAEGGCKSLTKSLAAGRSQRGLGVR